MISQTPLAERIRPQTLKEFFGQQHLLAPESSFSKMLQSNVIPSLIFYGPSGVGKTTLANLIAKQTSRKFYTLNATSSSVKDIRFVIDRAKDTEIFGTFEQPILFIDEIHRFSKSQQDALLKAVEEGTVCLIGATTENPSFEINNALLSRCQVFTLKKLSDEELEEVMKSAFERDKILKEIPVTFEETSSLIKLSDGDARKLLNNIDILASTHLATHSETTPLTITNSLAEESLQKSLPNYDKAGNFHYDIISAFIKSMRAGKEQAAIYWLARMLEAKEDLKFIARRLVIFAAEDIGLANPNALLLAQSCFDAVSVIGYPESEIILSQATLYLTTSPKSRSAYDAIRRAKKFVQDTGSLPVPLNLTNNLSHFMQETPAQTNFLPPSATHQTFYFKDIPTPQQKTPQKPSQPATKIPSKPKSSKPKSVKPATPDEPPSF